MLRTKYLTFECWQVITDPECKYVILHCKLFGMLLNLVALYIPTPVVSGYFESMINKVALLPTCTALFLRDFNLVLDPALDRLRPFRGEAFPLGP